MAKTYEKSSWNDVVITSKRQTLKSSWPKFEDGRVKVKAMGEIGERAVAQALYGALTGRNEEPLDLDLGLNYFKMGLIPITTQQLVELKMLTSKEERGIQKDDGVDVILLPKHWIEERKRLNGTVARANPQLCFQVKLQPWAPNYNGITVELGKDLNYKAWRDYNGQSLQPDGVNKSVAKWTAYIVGGGTILFFETAKLRKLAYENKPKYIGTPWPVWDRPGQYQANVGTYLSFNTIFKTRAAQPLSVSEVFRDYFAQLHDPLVDKDTPANNSWKLFVQDWPVKTLMNFVEGGLSSVDENLIRGNK
ncbi:MAG: hypothetical protein ACRDCE_08865 [Cetobacterium sp.]|uniref:hypothetical protein n=1 Tax=Cetobacterium sp. TaxID=2071632 RepID=UPI003EE76C2E